MEVIYRPSSTGAKMASEDLGLGLPPLNQRTHVENGIRMDQHVPVKVPRTASSVPGPPDRRPRVADCHGSLRDQLSLSGRGVRVIPGFRRTGQVQGRHVGSDNHAPIGHECEIGGANDRCVMPPYGIFSGMPGLHSENKIVHPDGSETPIDRAGGEIAREGDVLYFRAPGGAATAIPSAAISTISSTIWTSASCREKALGETTRPSWTKLRDR